MSVITDEFASTEVNSKVVQRKVTEMCCVCLVRGVTVTGCDGSSCVFCSPDEVCSVC